jgi:hypothetical protein
MSDEPTTTGPNPRALLAFLAAILAAQAFYAGVGILGEPGATSTPLRLLLSACFVVYAAMVAAFAFAVWRASWWAWHLAVVIAISGLAIAAVRIAGGDALGEHALGMIIDGALLFYLQRPSIKALFGR